MPYIVQETNEENSDLVKVKADEQLLDALIQMIEHNFCRLPILDEDGKPRGFVTSDSILRVGKNNCNYDKLH